MKKVSKNKIIIITICFLILINFLFFWIGYQSFTYPKLGKFDILGLEENQNQLILKVTPCHNAVLYDAKFYQEDKLIYETTSQTEEISLENFEADYQTELTAIVIAQNKNKEEQESNTPYVYLSQEESFSKKENHLLAKEKDLTLTILGYLENQDTYVELYYQENKLYETPVTSEIVTIPYQVVEGYSGRITALLKKANGRTISSFSFYLNTPIVGKLKITSPQNEYQTRWDEVQLKYKGGENANHFFINFYADQVFQKRVEFTSNNQTILIPAEFFEENKKYQLELEAVYEDFVEIAEKDAIEINILGKETTNAVYTSHNPNYIKKGTMVTLKTITPDATIYYTTDGTEPTTSSLIYKTPFTINENVVIKTFAVSRNRNDSIRNTFSFQISDKVPVIYLSPSNQDENYGVQKTGFTTEMEMMNKIADVIEKELQKEGIIVWRNNPKGDINAWSSKSRQVHADFHFAIHSNASSHHTARGPEIYIDKESSPAFSIASNIYENLWTIYDGNTNLSYHRGIKYANGSLGEANDNYLPCSSLIEVAYHDEEHDAAWITNNIEKIGQNLARTIISYYN